MECTNSDANLKICDIVARWPGATHDQTIFNNSKIKQRFEDGVFKDSIIVGDSGYAVMSYLIPPLTHPLREEERFAEIMRFHQMIQKFSNKFEIGKKGDIEMRCYNPSNISYTLLCKEIMHVD